MPQKATCSIIQPLPVMFALLEEEAVRWAKRMVVAICSPATLSAGPWPCIPQKKCSVNHLKQDRQA